MHDDYDDYDDYDDARGRDEDDYRRVDYLGWLTQRGIDPTRTGLATLSTRQLRTITGAITRIMIESERKGKRLVTGCGS